MLIRDIIDCVKEHCRGSWMGRAIKDETTRDKVLWGDADVPCTGIVTTCFASVEVIRAAAARRANLIICHEALFWNHGDHTDWLADNAAFEAKRALLDANGICVWRCHDYIHSGVPEEYFIGLAEQGSPAAPVAEHAPAAAPAPAAPTPVAPAAPAPAGRAASRPTRYVDGIFTGLAAKLGWLAYRADPVELAMRYEIPETSAGELARFLVCALGLNGTRIVGDPTARVRSVAVPMHIMGPGDNDVIREVNAGVDCLVTMELTDYTVSEYVRDAAALGLGKAIVCIGHFNVEEPGMELMASWLPRILAEKNLQLVAAPTAAASLTTAGPVTSAEPRGGKPAAAAAPRGGKPAGAAAPPVSFVASGDPFRFVLAG